MSLNKLIIIKVVYEKFNKLSGFSTLIKAELVLVMNEREFINVLAQIFLRNLQLVNVIDRF